MNTKSNGFPLLRIAVVAFLVIVIIIFFVVLILLFFFVWFFSKEVIGGDRVLKSEVWIHSVHEQWYASRTLRLRQSAYLAITEIGAVMFFNLSGLLT